jgi:hypothetical protein
MELGEHKSYVSLAMNMNGELLEKVHLKNTVFNLVYGKTWEIHEQQMDLILDRVVISF